MASQGIKFIESLCKGCGYCIEFCPNGVFEKSNQRSEKGTVVPEIVHSEKCTLCDLCTMLCPDFALTIGEVDAR